MSRIVVMTGLLATGLAFAGDAPTHVFLLMGQSNMGGRAKAGPGDDAPLEGVLLLNNKSEWEPAVHPLNKYGPDSKKPQVGPGGDFARALREARPGMRVGLVVHARGATAIEEWRADGTLYPGAIARVKAAGDRTCICSQDYLYCIAKSVRGRRSGSWFVATNGPSRPRSPVAAQAGRSARCTAMRCAFTRTGVN
jgi:hypothetical protein